MEELKQLADAGALGHGYLFAGPARIGKRTVATSLAGYLETGEFAIPAILSDALLISPNDSNTIGIDEARALKSFLLERPNRSSRRTVIIDNAENLSDQAQNALLKVSEDPPPSALIILILRDPQALRETLRSRFHTRTFTSVPEASIASWLEREYEIPKEKATGYSHAAHGAPGYAWALAFDARTQEVLKYAEKLRTTPARDRSKVFKAVTEKISDGVFLPEEFVDALIMTEYHAPHHNKQLLAHLVGLRKTIATNQVNLRLQLTSIFQS